MGPVLILGGTREARELADRLHADGIPAIVSLAGRLPSPHPPAPDTRIGGFGGAKGLARWLHEHEVRALIDATHPFAARIQASAAAQTVPKLRLERPGWTPRPGEHWVSDLQAAAAAIPADSRVLLTTGRQELVPFAHISAAWFLIRAITAPEPPLPPNHQIHQARGPFALADELELLDRHQIDLLITKDSGGPAPKREAAHRRGIPAIVVRRPPKLTGIQTVATIDEAHRWAMSSHARAGLSAVDPTRRSA